MKAEYSCADFLSLVSSHIGPSLLPEHTTIRLNQILSEFPAVSLVNLEFRLEEANDNVDTNILIRQYEIPLLEKYISGKTGAAFTALKKWCKDWQDPNMPFQFMVSHIWIMFDVEPDNTIPPEPWIILSFRPLNVSFDVKLALIKKLVPYFTHHVSDAHWSTLHQIYSSKPSKGVVPALGIQNRKPPSLRTGVKPFYAFHEIESFLKNLGWDGEIEVLRNAYAPFIELASFTMLSLTFNEKINTDIGIECWLDIPNKKSQIIAILDRLVDMKLCSDAKREELIQTIAALEIEKDIWSLSPSSTQMDNDGKIDMLISEIKLLYSKKNGLSAKAYLYFERKF
jgi:hypothetical protein